MLGLISTKANGEWATVSLHLPGECAQRIGILLWDNKTDQLHFRFRTSWWSSLEDDGWSEFGQDLAQQAREIGAVQFFDYLETASHVLRIDARQAGRIRDVDSTLTKLFIRHVGQSFETNRFLPPERSRSAARFPRRWAFVGLAAIIFMGAFISASIGSKPPIRTAAPASEYTMIDLPVSRIYQPPLPLLLSRIPLVRRVTGRNVPPSVRPSHLELSSVRIPVPVMQRDVPPPPDVPLEVASISDMPVDLPQLPQYIPRHNWFVKVLTVIASTLRDAIKAEPAEDNSLQQGDNSTYSDSPATR